MCQLKLEDLKFFTIFMVYMQECMDVRLKSLIYRCENHSQGVTVGNINF